VDVDAAAEREVGVGDRRVVLVRGGGGGTAQGTREHGEENGEERPYETESAGPGHGLTPSAVA
jgi:hypothetical protein